jgi:hypothetical protein
MRILSMMSLALAIAACGNASDICDHGSAVERDIEARSAPCVTSATTTEVVFTSVCKTDEKSCNANDTKIINDFYDCLDAVPAPSCPASLSDSDKKNALNAYEQSEGNCDTSTQITTISAACSDALTSSSSTAVNR